MSACSWGLIHGAKVVETCIQLGHYELEYGLLTDTAYCNIGIDMQWNAHWHFTSLSANVLEVQNINVHGVWCCPVECQSIIIILMGLSGWKSVRWHRVCMGRLYRYKCQMWIYIYMMLRYLIQYALWNLIRLHWDTFQIGMDNNVR